MRTFSILARSLVLLILISLIAGLLLAACAKPAVQQAAPADQPARLEADRAVMADGYELPLTTWAPDSGTPQVVVLALHGFNDYSGGFSELGSRLAQDGILTYAYDQRGFGATAGRGIWAGVDPLVNDARTVLALLRKRHPDTPIYLLGMSMGGAVAVNAMTRDPRPAADGTVLVAPAVWARQTMPWYQRVALSIGSRLMPSHKLTGKGLGIRPSDNIEMLRAMGQDPLMIRETRVDAVYGLGNLMDAALAAIPALSHDTLILYGEKDQIIPHRPTCRMLETLPSAPPADWRFVLYPDGYHMLTRDLQRAVVHADISAWMHTPDSPLPSELETDRAAAVQQLCDRPLQTASN